MKLLHQLPDRILRTLHETLTDCGRRRKEAGTFSATTFAPFRQSPMRNKRPECGRGLSAPTESSAICQGSRGAEAPPTFNGDTAHLFTMPMRDRKTAGTSHEPAGDELVARLSKVETRGVTTTRLDFGKSSYVHGCEILAIGCLACLITIAVSAAEPLVSFDFEGNLKNAGTLGGAAQFKTYAPGEDAGFDFGPFGRCLDLTASSRHGGAGAKQPPAGAAVVFRHEALDKLDTFTITLWSRQSPLAHGSNARLLTKENSWDLLPAAGGASLALGPGAGKVSYNLTGKTREKLEDRWRFTAVVVGPESIRVYTGGPGQPLVMNAEKPRSEHKAAARGDLVLGTLGGIRPFNGWLDRVRVFGSALDEKAIRAIFDTDNASAKQARSTTVYDLVRPPANTHRFHLKRSDIPFSVRWQKRTEAPALMESFHTTQCLWVYGTQTNFIQQIKGMGIGYQGTLNGLQGHEHSTTNKFARGDSSGRH
ncbi:MAG: LamG domain-containing protein, partial [Verrucomicrobia bacterium]|nr:LamG domain-containing protein [Verrucomicrobiota bacterium]